MEWIDEVICGLFDTYGTNDPYELCDCLGISVNKVPPESPMLCNNKSLYIRDYCDNELIFLSNDISERYAQFYLRHELGHALLHTSVDCSAFCNKGKLELQANYFAFKLSNYYLDEIEFNEMTIDQIACCLEMPMDTLKQLANNERM